MTLLKPALIQTPLHWEDKQQNLSMFEEWFSKVNAAADLVVLPEMFATAFSMQTSLADTMEGDTLLWLKTQAQKLNKPICGSLMMRDGEHFVNRFIWMYPDGTAQTYDKRHLFRMGDEHHHFASGSERIVIDFNGWKLFPVVCYDLRFPVWLRRTPEFDYDVLLIVANWPERREHHWRTLLQARAIENQCYVIAVNRIGMDGNQVNHSGSSGIISPKGEWLLDMKSVEQCDSLDIHLSEVIDWRTSFPAQNDADGFTLR